MRRDGRAGFTLIELLVAIAITVMITSTMMTTLWYTMQARQEVEALSEPLRDGPRILSLIRRDLRGMTCFNIKDYKLLEGRDMDRAGRSADRLNFVTSVHSLYPHQYEGKSFTAPWCEVGYWIKDNPDNPDLLELWRREDIFSDDLPFEGGQFQLLSNRVRSFNITYFDTLGYEAEPRDEWNTAEDGVLPRRIRIELELERDAKMSRLVEVEDYEGRKVQYRLEYTFPGWREESLLQGNMLAALIPPGPPTAESSPAGGGQPEGPTMGGGAGGPAGPGGRGPRGPAGTTAGRVGGRPGTGGPRNPTGSTPMTFPSGGGRTSLDQLLRQLGAGGGSGGMGGIFGGGGGR